ncbi:hypothetical protein CJP46_02665 [Paenibacillus sp. XY044]|nr:hypothetical protein CJP46_02665 [Paenibacillus sp. XY044]
MQAFWFGANGCEYVAWKGSHQIYVYPTDEYPSPPSYIIQHKKRIETLEEFDNALIHGIRMRATYSEIGTGVFGD